MEKLEEGIRDQILDASIWGQEKDRKEGDDAATCVETLPVSVGVLLYTSMSLARELRVLLRGVVKAFPGRQGPVAWEISEQESKKTMIPEKMLMLVMGGR